MYPEFIVPLRVARIWQPFSLHSAPFRFVTTTIDMRFFKAKNTRSQHGGTVIPAGTTIELFKWDHKSWPPNYLLFVVVPSDRTKPRYRRIAYSDLDQYFANYRLKP